MLTNESVIKHRSKIDALVNELKSAEHCILDWKIRSALLEGQRKVFSVLAQMRTLNLTYVSALPKLIVNEVSKKESSFCDTSCTIKAVTISDSVEAESEIVTA